MPLPSPLITRQAGGTGRAHVTLSAVGASKPPPPGFAERVLQFQATVLSHEKFDEAAAAFATEIATLLHFDRAAIGFSAGGHCRVIATSHTADFQAKAELFSAYAAAMDEALDQGSTIVFPAAEGARPLITRAHAALSRHYGGAVCTVPLVRRGSAYGALTLARADAAAPGRDDVTLCEHLGCIVGPILELKREAERSWHDRLLRGLRQAARCIVDPGHTGVKVGAGLATAALLALFLVPFQYRVGAQARVEGSIQRALVAPSDGFLRQVHARPGERVRADQVVAELAEDDLRIENRKWQSELTQHENAASAALARSDRAQYVINQAKADEARAQLDLVDGQLSRTRIVAPFDGVVIKGDLSQSLGAPVRRGDILLTVAPVDQYRLVIEVDERDIPAVQAGQTGRVALGALSDRALAFRVARVTPVATTRDGRVFFEVEGALEEAPPVLRPGLQGVAKIIVGERPLAWIWTHRAFEWLRFALWSWGV